MSNQDRAEGVISAFLDAMEKKHGYRPMQWPNGEPVNGRDFDRLEGFKMAIATLQAPGADTPGGRGEAVVVQRNSCTCHPETCCCREYGLLVGFEVLATGDREGMEKLASLIRRHPAESSGGDAVGQFRLHFRFYREDPTEEGDYLLYNQCDGYHLVSAAFEDGEFLGFYSWGGGLVDRNHFRAWAKLPVSHEDLFNIFSKEATNYPWEDKGVAAIASGAECGR